MACHLAPTGNNVIPNCVEYSTDDGETWECESCSGRFYRDYSTKRCVAINSDLTVDNCGEYGSASMCGDCADNYFSPNTNICRLCPLGNK